MPVRKTDKKICIDYVRENGLINQRYTRKTVQVYASPTGRQIVKLKGNWYALGNRNRWGYTFNLDKPYVMPKSATRRLSAPEKRAKEYREAKKALLAALTPAQIAILGIQLRRNY